MRRHRTKRNARRTTDQDGVVIVLVGVVLLFVVGAMAALSIDVVTLYTARSEAQLAADAGALAGARVLANSGMTSAVDSTVGVNAIPLAVAVAKQVAASNLVGGRVLTAAGACPGGEVCVTINQGATNFLRNPQVVVQVQRTDLPTFFARIWGRTTIAVKATSTAEAYNPSGGTLISGGAPNVPVAPGCVKPWLLPNLNPAGPGQIFDPLSGNISNYGLLGWSNGATYFKTACDINCGTLVVPTPWQFYPGDPGNFPAPNAATVMCPGCSGFDNYQLSVAGCVQPPIACNATVNVDTASDATRDADTAVAVNAMTYSTANGGDSVNVLATPTPPFQFSAGTDNPLVQLTKIPATTDIMVSNSLVTVPVMDTTSLAGTYPQVQIIGFVQLFLNPTGVASVSGQIQTKVINLVGCGTTGTAGSPIIGNGASPVTVRLVSGS